MRKVFNKILMIVLAISLITTIGNIKVFADINDVVNFIHREDKKTEHDVNKYYVNDSSKPLEAETIYCLQHDFVYPKDWVNYVEAPISDTLLNQEQLAKLTKLMFVGYPYNVLGFLDPIYDMNLVESEFFNADTLAAMVTQEAVWHYVSSWGVEGNTDYEFAGYEDEMLEAYNSILAFVDDPNSQVPETNNVPETITITGSGQFKKASNGEWYTDKLKITEPTGFQLRFEYSLPDGIIAVDLDGNELVEIKENTEFRLKTSDPTKITGTINLEAETVLKWPTNVTYYNTNDIAPTQFGKGKFQTMLAMKIASKNLSGQKQLSLEPLGSITIQKEVDSNHIDIAKDQKFWFELTLGYDDQNGSQATDVYPFTRTHKDGTTSNGKLELFNDGKMRFYLQEGEKITIAGIPERSNYSVNEYGLSESGNSLGNWTVEYENSINSGTIASDTYVKAKNTYNFTPIEFNVKGNKTITGTNAPALTKGEFSFTLFGDVHGQPMPTGSSLNKNTNREEITVSNGTETSVNEINFGTITFKEPGTYNYTIIENQVTIPNISRDMCHWHMTVEVSSNGGSLVASPTYTHHHDDSHKPSVGCDHQPINFENVFNPSRIDKDIHITKTIVNNSSDKTVSRNGFEFEIAPDMSKKLAEQSDENYLLKFPTFSGTSPASKSTIAKTGDSGEAYSGVLEFTEDWFMENNDQDQVELDYTIKEVIPNSLPTGWQNYDNRIAKAHVIIKKNVDNSYTAKITYAFGDEKATETSPIFKNTYSATGEVNLNVVKNFNPTSYIPSNGETYSFSINDNFERNDETGYKLPESGKVKLTYNNGTWSISDNKILFTKEGDYRFELSEDAVNSEHMTYDSSKWIVDIAVTDNTVSGILETSSSYYHESSSSTPNSDDKAVFTNTYDAYVTTNLDIEKTLVGRNWKDTDVFEFVVQHSELGTNSESSFDPCASENLEKNHTNMTHPLEVLIGNQTIDHKAKISNIKFTKEGVYYLNIKERHNDLIKEMVYDPTLYVVRYDVVKQGNDLVINDTKIYDVTNGWNNKTELSITELEFINIVPGFSLTKANNDGSKTDKFEFKLTLKDSADQLVTNISACANKNGEDILVNFDENGESTVYLKRNETIIVYLAQNYKVTVTETSDIPSKTSYELFVDGVIHGSTNEGKTTTVTLEASKDKNVVFTNVEQSELKVVKHVTGNLADKTKYFNFKVKLDDTSINGTYGDMQFVNGVAEFKLKDGESKVAKELTPGIKYVVTEESDGYESNASGDRGVLLGGRRTTANFINTLKTSHKDPENEPSTPYKAPNTGNR